MQYSQKQLNDCIHQLESLIDDRKSFLDGDPYHDDIFIEDAEALKFAVDILKELITND